MDNSIILIQENLRYLILIFGSLILAFTISLMLSPPFIKILHKYKIGKQLRDKATTGEEAVIFKELHAKKQGTPTMGGVVIWGTVIIMVLLSSLSTWLNITDNQLFNRAETLLPLFTLIATALLGAIDDYMNLKGHGKTKGIDLKPKFL